MFGSLLDGFQVALVPENIVWLLAGTAIGLVVGYLPAIGGTVGVALMLPFTYGLDPIPALVFLCAVQVAGQYGDSASSILINVPGGAGTVATCWDGFPMSQQGKSGRALGIATFSNLLGGLIGSLGLVALAWPLTQLAIAIGAAEYFALGIMALSLISIGAEGNLSKGLIMGCLGLILSFIGTDPITAVTDRFSFGSLHLAAGIPIVVSTLGIFALAQVLELLGQGSSIAGEMVKVKDSVLAGIGDVLRRPITVLRSGLVGMYIGILPALGVSLAGITAYLVEKKYSSEKDQFGKGAPAGLIAAEVGKGTCVVGDLIPTFALGVPGSITGAILMGALIIHGVQAGPTFLLSGTMPYAIFAGIILAQIAFTLAGLPLARVCSYLVYVPNAVLAPFIAVLCFFGAYVERNSPFDILFMIVLGVFGYIVRRMGYSVVCLVLGLIMGPLIEANFHRTLGMGFGSFGVFFTRPIAVTIIAITFLFIGWPYVRRLVAHLRGRQAERIVNVAGVQISKDLAAEEDGPIVRPLPKASELIFLVFLSLLGLLVFIEAGNYQFLVGLFPRMVSAFMLLLLAWRIVDSIQHGGLKATQGLRFPRVDLFKGALSWPLAIGLLIAYALFTYVVGFVASTAVYLVVTPWLMGYKNWRLVGAMVAASVVILIVGSRALGILLPPGMFVGYF